MSTNNTTANYPTAQELIAANPMLGVIALRCLRICREQGPEAARREMDALCWNYGQDMRPLIERVIAALAVD